MIKVIISIILISCLILSCKEDFSTEAKYRERNVLTCIISPDTSFQAVTLFRTYRVEGSPNQFTEYPFIDSADVKMWHDNQVYQFYDTTLERQNTGRYIESAKVYYNNSLKPIGGKYVEVEALLPNGLLLRAETLVPDVDKISFQGSSTEISSDNKNEIKFIWADEQRVMYDPRFLVVVSNKITHQLNTVEIPIKYIVRNSAEEQVYPSITSQKSVIYESAVIRKAFQNISKDDSVKSNYVITGAYLELMVLDKYLSTYYSSIENFLDEFTIKVDLPDYTNIDGGFGIFGSYNLIKYNIAVDKNFIKSFGYGAGF